MDKEIKPQHQSSTDYRVAVEAIKTAILQSQYEAAKNVNRVQLTVYFSIGKYLSHHTRKGVWGQGALESISQQLRRELPGLRGFSATSLKKMRLFYDNWAFLDANSSVTTDDLNQGNSSVITDDTINIYPTILLHETKDFPIEDFFKVPFTHHVEIFSRVKDISAR